MGAIPSGFVPPEPQIVLPRDAEVVPALDPLSVAEPHEPTDGETCSICLEADARVALPCRHAFHLRCLDRWFEIRPTCPNCGCAFGPRIGTMPDGEMLWHRSRARLAGHTCGTVVLHFSFPAGVTEGRRHAGRVQHAYLPDDAEGCALLALFQVAFRRRVLFSLDYSLTTGQYRPVFGVHLKTATCGGPARHGYPDPDYFAVALNELRAVGVEEGAATTTAFAVEPPTASTSFGPLAVQCMAPILHVCQLMCFASLLATQFQPRGQSVLMPSCAATLALRWPFHRVTLFCLMVFVLLYLADIDANDLGPPEIVVYAAAAYALVARLMAGRCDRPFRVVARGAQRLLWSISLRYTSALVFFVFVGGHYMAIGVGSAAVCALGGIWRDFVAIRRSLGNSQVGLSEPLIAGHQSEVPSVAAALAAASPPRPVAPGRPRAQRPQPIGEEDWPLFATCPSLRGRPNASDLHASLVTPGDEVARRVASIAVREMFQNEADFGEEYVVFYHSYSASCILYELQTALATLVLGYPVDGPPVLRLQRGAFQDVNSLDALLELHAGHRSDHATTFRHVAISSFVSWFASGGYGHSVLTRQFLRGYFGGHDLGDMSILLEKVLRACGVQDVQLLELVGEVLEVGDKWGLEMQRYKDRGRRRCGAETLTCPGHVMQIFVHASVVDAVAYGSLPLGRLAMGGIPISAWLARQSPLDGQARILMHPDLFLDVGSGLVHLFSHSGSPLYGPRQRRRLLQDLHRILAPHFDGPVARARARAGLGFVGGAEGEDVV